VIALIAFDFVSHIVTAGRADYSGAAAHVPALQTVVKPTLLVNIQKDIAAALGASVCFPFRHIYSPRLPNLAQLNRLNYFLFQEIQRRRGRKVSDREPRLSEAVSSAQASITMS
jgi:hypothetical protein